MDIEELRLVYNMGMKGFPPRKPEQPIFYPVLNLQYADEIAKQWNAKIETGSGFVAQFTLDDAYGTRFEHRKVGASYHLEFWVPAEELPSFNDHIAPPIVVVSAYFGKNFQGFIPEQFGLRGKNAMAQFIALARTMDYSVMDFRCEIAANHVAIFLNYSFWKQSSFLNQGITNVEQERVLSAIQAAWSSSFPEIPLPSAGARQ